MPEKVEGDGTVHGAAVYVVVTHTGGKLFGQSALAAGGVSVYRYYDLARCHLNKVQQ